METMEDAKKYLTGDLVAFSKVCKSTFGSGLNELPLLLLSKKGIGSFAWYCEAFYKYPLAKSKGDIIRRAIKEHNIKFIK